MSEKITTLASNLNKITVVTLKQLDNVWNEIGLDENAREQRHEMFYNHVKELYDDMIAEAESSKLNLLEQIETIGKELCTLKKDLRLEISLKGYENVPLYIAKEEMKNELQTYKDVYNTKKTEVNNLILHEKMLCQSLGISPKDFLTTPLPTLEEINQFQIYLEELSDLKFGREEEFIKLKGRIICIMDELKIKPSLDFERKVVVCEDSAFKVTDENMEQLRELHKSLENQLHETKIKVAELRERISSLWERLEESPQVRSAFLDAHPGHSVLTLLELKKELQKLEERKKANIKLFVEKMQQELVIWWNKCYLSDKERNEFVHFFSDCYTEDLLTLYEIEVDKFKNYHEKNIGIFNMYHKRAQLWEKFLDLEERANQPNRFKNRGGQLLNEEKERKAVAVQLPKVEKELLHLVEDYEEKYGKQFLIHGEPIEEMIKDGWKEHQENKKIKLSVKKKLRDQTFTPSKSVSSTSKRKLFTPVNEITKKSRIEASSTKSCLKLPSSSKVKTIDRHRRLEKIKKREHQQKINDTNYELFETGLETKDSCRSSLFSGRVLRSNSTNETPRRILTKVNNIRKTPLKQGFRPKSPIASSHLTAAPNNLPIII